MSSFELVMAPDEIAVFDRHVSAAWNYLEYGAGGSTLRALERVRGMVVSVESDADWIARLREHEAIAAAQRKGRVTFLHVDLGPVGAWGFPKGESQIRNWPRYATEPFARTELSFDVVLVDGRFRASTLLTLALMLGENAIVLVHDYARRHGYSIAEKYFDAVERVNTLAVLKRRANINTRALYIDLMQAMFETA